MTEHEHAYKRHRLTHGESGVQLLCDVCDHATPMWAYLESIQQQLVEEQAGAQMLLELKRRSAERAERAEGRLAMLTVAIKPLLAIKAIEHMWPYIMADIRRALTAANAPGRDKEESGANGR